MTTSTHSTIQLLCHLIEKYSHSNHPLKKIHPKLIKILVRLKILIQVNLQKISKLKIKYKRLQGETKKSLKADLICYTINLMQQ